jgi:hypothetical protein
VSTSPAKAHLAEVRYGFMLPLAARRAVLGDPLARRRYRLAAWLRAIVVLAVALVFGISLTAVADALEHVADLEARITRVAAVLSSMYASLCAIEWIVIALTHEYDDQTARRAAILIGAPPEDDERPPRVRLDFRWVKKRIKRQIRGYKVYLIGVPAISLVMCIPALGPLLYTWLLAAWTSYWIVVQTAAKSAAAWTEEGRAPAPWFLRLWDSATARVIGFRWWLPRLYGAQWRKHSEAMFSPCKAVEDAPYALLGLAISKTILSFPGVYLFFRPFFPVAAARIITSMRRPLIPPAPSFQWALAPLALTLAACGPSQEDWERLVRENERLRLSCASAPTTSASPSAPQPSRSSTPSLAPILGAPSDLSSLYMTEKSGLPPPQPKALAPARPVPVGMAVTMTHFRVTVTAVKECNQDFAAEGKVALGVEVLLENVSDQTWQVQYTGSIKDANGYEYQSMIVMNRCEPDLDPTSSVRPGDKLRGYVWTFVLPQTAKGLVLTYKLPLPRFDFEEVRFDLGR